MRMLFWGTADLGKPRTRILRKGLREKESLVAECVFDVWGDIDDKSQLNNLTDRLRVAWRWLIAYPVLIWRYLRAPKHDTVFVAYMGHLDVLVLWPFARLRGAKIVWDAFLSLYDTIIDDRELFRRKSVFAQLIGLVERLACAAADVIILDTAEHARYFQERYTIKAGKLVSVWVGAETETFKPTPNKDTQRPETALQVLFYGQFIPLHGIEHIIEAVRLTRDSDVSWTIVGRGQEKERIHNAISGDDLRDVRFIDWIQYEQLPEAISAADVCLGVFGKSAKAARVIPNKVFQVLASQRPLITMDSPAIREIVSPATPGVWLIEPGSGAALAEAINKVLQWRKDDGKIYGDMRAEISPEAISDKLLGALHSRL